MSNFTFATLMVFVFSCIAFQISWWLYGKTLSETFPGFVVLIIMLITVFGSFIAFNLLFREVCSNIFSHDWGYVTENDEFIPYTYNIAYILASIMTVGISVLFYKNEGKIIRSKYDHLLTRKNKNGLRK